jgi:hypothetical protein
LMLQMIDSDNEDDPEQVQRWRLVLPTADEYRLSNCWDIYLSKPSVADTRSVIGKQSRTAFRVPLPIDSALTLGSDHSRVRGFRGGQRRPASDFIEIEGACPPTLGTK